jgi:sugar diacid utilization regulator
MNQTHQIIAATLCALALSVSAQAADKEEKAESAQPAQKASETKRPEMAEMPFMKAEAKRLATLMERLQKETDPAERRKIMAETSCAQ